MVKQSKLFSTDEEAIRAEFAVHYLDWLPLFLCKFYLLLLETDCSVRGRSWKYRRLPFVNFDQGKKSLDFNSDNMNLTKMNKGGKL